MDKKVGLLTGGGGLPGVEPGTARGRHARTGPWV